MHLSCVRSKQRNIDLFKVWNRYHNIKMAPNFDFFGRLQACFYVMVYFGECIQTAISRNLSCSLIIPITPSQATADN